MADQQPYQKTLHMPHTLTLEQSSVLDDIIVWLDSEPQRPFYVLEGGAGTGKTFLIRELRHRRPKCRVVYTAPTNKATRELRRSVTTPEYRAQCCTIYSLLGLVMQANGEVKELSAPEDPIDLSAIDLIVVDEGSMVSQVLQTHIQAAARDHGVKILYMGDRAQLPPVKESASPIWSMERRGELTKVMRYDNQILRLATDLRQQALSTPFRPYAFASDNNPTLSEGIWLYNDRDFKGLILDRAEEFRKPDHAKVVCWRNVTVDAFNQLIRARLFRNEIEPWLSTDRVIYTAPASDLDDRPMAHTDDEGTIERVEVDYHPLYGDFQCYRITINMDEGKPTIAWVLHPASKMAFLKHENDLATAARADRRRWRNYWDFKEAFHSLRHSYAITSHRAQGSTYNSAFVNYRDILVNPSKKEAWQCLYVAATRPRKELVLG